MDVVRADVAAAVAAWMFCFALAWVPVKDAFTGALSRLHTQGWQPTLGEEGVTSIPPPSILVLTRISQRHTGDQSQVKAGAFTILL